MNFAAPLYLLKVTVFSQLKINFYSFAFFLIKSLVEITGGVIFAYFRYILHGAGRSLTFLICGSKKQGFFVGGAYKIAVPSFIFLSVIARRGSSYAFKG